MVQKKQRTIDEYKKVGAEMRLFKQLGNKLCVDASQVLSAADTDKLMRALGRVDEVCSRAEDNMFHDHPEISNDYLSVFYGSLDERPRNPVDAEVKEKARQVANAILK